MSTPLFLVTAAARFDVTPGSPSLSAYNALVAKYQFGNPVIPPGVISPVSLAIASGIPFYNAVGDPGIPASIPGVVVASFPNPVPSVIIAGVAYPVNVNAGGATLFGVNYVDPNGQLHPDVDWAWSISVEGYTNTNAAAPPLGTFDVAVVQYTGDGTSNRAIAAGLDLTKGVVAIWICGVGNPLTTRDINIFRANHAAMLGTSIMGNGVGLPVTGSGIMAFTSTGFTVTDGNVVGTHYANGSTTKYTAIVLRDTTTDNRYLRTGRYLGNNTAGRVITTPGAATPLTHVWVWGRSVAYRSTDFVGDAAVELANEADPLTGVMSAFGSPSFTIGTDNNVNNNTSPYDYMALSVDSVLAAKHLFASFSGVGSATPPVVVALPFQPGVAFARPFTAASGGGIWRGPDHAGTDSAFCSNIGASNDIPANGIAALGVASLALGSVAAPNGVTSFGFLFKAGSASIPASPIYVPIGGGDIPPPFPPPFPPGGVCTASIAPGAGNVGTPGCDADVAVPPNTQ